MSGERLKFVQGQRVIVNGIPRWFHGTFTSGEGVKYDFVHLTDVCGDEVARYTLFKDLVPRGEDFFTGKGHSHHDSPPITGPSAGRTSIDLYARALEITSREVPA